MHARATRDPSGKLLARIRLVSGFARRDILTRYAGSYLGVAWALAVPLLSSVVYILVFGVLMRGTLLGERYRQFDFVTFYFLGFAPWMLFAEVVGRAPTVLRENRNLIRNVRFEHRLLPLVIFVSATVAHVVLLLIAAALAAVKGYGASHYLYLLPVYFALLFALSTGIAYLLAALSAYLPDLGQIVPIFLNLYFFACPIIYTPDLVAQAGSPLARLLLVDANPMAQIIEGYRLAVLQVGPPDAFQLGFLASGCLLVFAFGLLAYRHLERGFADVL